MDLEAEKSTYNAFERFLYWFFIPVVFTAVLAGALLSMFDYDFKNQLLRMGHSIPVIGSVLPEPETETSTQTAADGTTTAGTDSTAKLQEKIKALMAQLEEKNAQIQDSESSLQAKDQTIKDLEAKAAAAAQDADTQKKTQEEYDAKVKETASLYAKMNPSKSAPIIQNLTLQEQVLLFSQMKTEDRVKIMEKMDPKAAAQASIYLKDVTPVRDQEIAALQERLKLQDQSAGSTTTSSMTKQDLSKTIAGMTPASAGALLIDMNKISSAKVIEILNGMDVASRSKIMDVISKSNKDIAVTIAAKLAP